MKNTIEKFNEKRYRVCKEEYQPFKEKYGIVVAVVGIFIGLGIPALLFQIYRKTHPTSIVFVLAGVAVFIVGVWMVSSSFKVLFTLKEVTNKNLICYEHTWKDKETSKKRKTVYESFSDAEMSIEKTKEENKELELEPMP